MSHFAFTQLDDVAILNKLEASRTSFSRRCVVCDVDLGNARGRRLNYNAKCCSAGCKQRLYRARKRLKDPEAVR